MILNDNSGNVMCETRNFVSFYLLETRGYGKCGWMMLTVVEHIVVTTNKYLHDVIRGLTTCPIIQMEQVTKTVIFFMGSRCKEEDSCSRLLLIPRIESNVHDFSP